MHEQVNTPKISGGLSVGAAMVIAAIIIFVGMHQISRSIGKLEGGLYSQSQEMKHANELATAANNYPDIMDLDQAAAYLNISVDQLKYLAAPESGINLPVLVVDGQYRFSRTAIDEWMKTPHRLD